MPGQIPRGTGSSSPTAWDPHLAPPLICHLSRRWADRSIHARIFFLFGILLYEMCTGRSPFPGDTTGELLIAIVQQVQITPAQLNPNVPDGLARIINRCLEKDRELRYQHAGQIRADLEELQLNHANPPNSPSPGSRIEPLMQVSSRCRTLESASPGRGFLPRSGEGRPAPALQRRGRLLFLALPVVAALLTFFLTRPLSAPKASNYVQLTSDGLQKNLVGTDGSRLFLGWGSDTSDGVAEVPISGGEPVLIRPDSGPIRPLGISQDGTQLLAADRSRTLLAADHYATAEAGQLLRVPILGGSPYRLSSLVAQAAAWSPNGRLLVYAAGGELFLARNDGTESRKLVSVDGRVFNLAWSPAGDKVRFTVIDFKTRGNSLWEVSAQGTNPHPLFPGWHNPPNECCGKWTADGKYFVFQSRGQIWALSEKRIFPHLFARTPVQLSSSPLGLFTPLPGKDGKKLFVVGHTYRGELEHRDSESGRFTPFLSGISADGAVFSKDGQWVAYVSYPEGILWRSKPDASEKIQLSSPPLVAAWPRWSPDGKRIAFYNYSVGKPGRIYLVSADGGSPEQLLPEDPEPKQDPDWSPDGNKIIFGGVPPDHNSVIRVVDLRTHQVDALPGSRGLYSPRWSPDGRYIVAMPVDSLSLVLFDFSTQKWSQLAEARAGFPNWSKDGQSVYFLRSQDHPAVMRVRISDREVEQVADLSDLPTTGSIGPWLGLGPADSVLVLKDIGTQDIYSLDWQEP